VKEWSGKTMTVHLFTFSLDHFLTATGRIGNAGNCHIAVRGVQGAELLDDEEQKDDHWPPGVQEVL
jgi:hypothetical protein